MNKSMKVMIGSKKVMIGSIYRASASPPPFDDMAVTDVLSGMG